MERLRAPGRDISIGAAVRRLNPHLFRTLDTEVKQILNQAPLRPRIQQSKSAGPNKLEREAMLYLKLVHPNMQLQFHGFTLRLGNGVRYTPDIVGIQSVMPQINFWEVKGRKAWDDAIVKLKVAAAMWPTIPFVLFYKNGDRWVGQRVLP